jgi:hypothetical protein
MVPGYPTLRGPQHPPELVDHVRRLGLAGVDLAARFLEENGVTDGRVDTVWDAIALHTSGGIWRSPVYQRRRPPESGIALEGVGIDISGGPEELPPGYAERVPSPTPSRPGAWPTRPLRRR